MTWPENFQEQIEESKKTDQKLIDVKMLSGDNQEIDPNLIGWSITEISSTRIKMKLDFAKVLEVAQGDEPDFIFFQVNLSAFRDNNQARLPTSVLKYKELP